MQIDDNRLIFAGFKIRYLADNAEFVNRIPGMEHLPIRSVLPVEVRFEESETDAGPRITKLIAVRRADERPNE